MTRRQRDELVAVRADSILAEAPAVEAYRLYFEAQMRRGKVRRLLSASSAQFARFGAVLCWLDVSQLQ